ncbi:hypothetical protein ALQ90_200120 [Pseudomonas savastanoi pv. savastanoi]|nr:hypothetical protein ALQ90_200120 [Pseudomonas savastanoi pv. savastanoi]
MKVVEVREPTGNFGVVERWIQNLAPHRYGRLIGHDQPLVHVLGMIEIRHEQVPTVGILLMQHLGHRHHVAGVNGHHHRQTGGQVQAARRGITLGIQNGVDRIERAAHHQEMLLFGSILEEELLTLGWDVLQRLERSRGIKKRHHQGTASCLTNVGRRGYSLPHQVGVRRVCGGQPVVKSLGSQRLLGVGNSAITSSVFLGLLGPGPNVQAGDRIRLTASRRPVGHILGRIGTVVVDEPACRATIQKATIDAAFLAVLVIDRRDTLPTTVHHRHAFDHQAGLSQYIQKL